MTQKIFQHLNYVILHVNLTSGSLLAYNVQMVALILERLQQHQLPNFCSRLFFSLFYRTCWKWSLIHLIHLIGSVSQLTGEETCFRKRHNWTCLSIRRSLIDEEMRHKPVHGRRQSLSNLMHVCESCCQHVGRKSQKIIFKAAGDSGSPGSCASLKHSNEMVWKMDLRLLTSAGTP